MKVTLIRCGKKILESEGEDALTVALASMIAVHENPVEVYATLLVVKEAIKAGILGFRGKVGSVEVSVERAGAE